MNETALEQLVGRAQAAHSDALVVRQHDKAIGEWHFGQEPEPILTMSCTKSFVSLAIGGLIDDGQIDGLDQLVCDFYPEWKQGNKQHITVRHILNHTSGIQNLPNAGIEVEGSPDWVQLALAAELSDPPGTSFAYNNKAVNLLAGITKRASGQPLDDYLRDRIFQPLDITNFSWYYDTVENPYVAGGLSLLATDVAKLGQLVLNQGRWNGQQVISSDWITTSLAQGQPHYPLCGLLWWREPDYETFTITEETFAKLQAARASAGFLHAIEPLVNRTFANGTDYRSALNNALGPEWWEIVSSEVSKVGQALEKREFGDIIGYWAQGYLGQYLIILPKEELLAVRMVRRKPEYSQDTDSFSDFKDVVRTLA